VNLPPVLVYTVLRLLAFLVPLGLMMLLPIFRDNWLLAVIFAALIGLSLSMIFLRRPLDAVTGEMAAKRQRRRSESAASQDEEIEDAATDAPRPSGDERPGQQPRVDE
jgi:hypothetical protein